MTLPTLRTAVGLLVAATACLPTPVVAQTESSLDDGERPECLVLAELTHISTADKSRHGLLEDEYYFCAPDAPVQFQCQCPPSTVCNTKVTSESPPRELGTCTCCALWVYGILAALGAMGFAALLFCSYLCFCRGEWWCDGYHPPVNPFLPRRGAPVVIPGSLPLPNGVFRGFRPAEFDSGLSPEDLARAREAQQRQRAAAQAAAEQQRAMREEQRRRREAIARGEDPDAAAQEPAAGAEGDGDAGSDGDTTSI